MFGALARLPWYGHLVFATALAAFAVWMHGDMERIEAEKAAALSRPVPEAVPLAEFRKDRDIHIADEVHVLGWINGAYNYHLTKQRRGVDTERYMFVLFDGADDAAARMARAAVLLTPNQKDRFVDWLLDNNAPGETFGSLGTADSATPVYRLNGTTERSPTLRGMAEDAFAESGLTRAPDFVYIAPFLDGRAAAFAPNPEMPMQVAAVVGAIAGVFLLAALVKFRRKRRASRVSAAMQTVDWPVDPSPVADPAAPADGQTARASRLRWLRSPFLWVIAAFVAFSFVHERPAALVFLSMLPTLFLVLGVLCVYRIIRSLRRRFGESRHASAENGQPVVETLGEDGHNSAFAAEPEDDDTAPDDTEVTPARDEIVQLCDIDPRFPITPRSQPKSNGDRGFRGQPPSPGYAGVGPSP
ncbi:hypothetical protein [Tropicimonas marinistellae]|uniref:hypothetical protein n=1 Tax=Tropicimonas marinistellae TaxID=1739787 RepID=UPI00082E2D00|nr:hypothetical protein [Tropicimonas marinistellae]